MIIILVLIGVFSIIIALTVSAIRDSIKMRKEAELAKPSDDRIYKVFAIDVDGTTYHVIKKYWYNDWKNTYGWSLQLDFSAYKNMTEEKVIELCDKFNERHLEELHKTKMNRLLESTQGNIIH